MISIVIPVYGQHDMTRDCVTAVRQHTEDCEIILVDNGSTPPLERPYTGFIPCRVIRNEQNLGFPKAVNQGIAIAEGETIVLLNNDVIVTPSWAKKLTAALAQGFSIVGPSTNYSAGRQAVQIGTYEDEVTLNQRAAEWAEEWQDAIAEVKWVIGFCMVFPRALWDELGPFDESIWPSSGEEIDFCLRARQAGHHVGIVMGAYVHHEGSQTFRAMPEVDYADLCRKTNAHIAERWGKEALNQTVRGLAVPSEALRLNLGCGRYHLEGFVNLDAAPHVNPDVVADALVLPYDAESVDEIYAGHLLEHFTWEEGQAALRHWYSRLKPGGILRVTVPDFDVLAARYLSRGTPEALRELNDVYLFSYVQESRHRYAYAEGLLRQAMEAAGFTDLQRLPVDHPYFVAAVDWQVGIEGVKPCA